MAGTSLFWPLTMPASTQPVTTLDTSRAFDRSTGGPQAEAAARTIAAASEASARMRAILEHSHVDPLQRVVLGQLAGAKRGEIAAPDSDDHGLCVAVGGRDDWPLVVPPGRDRQPFIGADRERAAPVEHRVHDLGSDLGAVSVV